MDWISVKQQLPQAKHPVLVLTNVEANDYQEFNHMQVAYLEEEKWVTKDSLLAEVTHWMPLPPLPNEQFEAIKGVADSVADLYAPADRSLQQFSFNIKAEGTPYLVTYQKDADGYWTFADYQAQ